MFRRLLFWSLAALALLVFTLAVVSQRSGWIVFEGSSGFWGFDVALRRGLFMLDGFCEPKTVCMPIIQSLPRWFELLGISYRADGPPGGGYHVALQASLWSATLLLGAYPAGWLILIPFRRAYRRSHQRCHKCRYTLVGNPSGVCPECGEPLVTAFLPPWQRACVALATALLLGMLLEYAIQQFSLQHRIALFLIRWFRTDASAWVFTALLRCVPVAAGALGAYLYLDPKRFPDHKQ